MESLLYYYVMIAAWQCILQWHAVIFKQSFRLARCHFSKCYLCDSNLQNLSFS